MMIANTIAPLFVPTNPQISLRPMTEADLAFVREVYYSTRVEELAPVPWTEAQKAAFLDMQFNAQHSWYQQQHPAAHWDLILRDGEPAGRLYLDGSTEQLQLIDIALLPAFRNQGIGTSLLNDILALGRPITIYVEQFNPAQRLYQRLGFRKLAEDGVYWLMEWRGGSEGETGRRGDGEIEDA